MTDNVKNMINGFMHYHNQGKTIREIAEIFGVTSRTVYANLNIIAQNNNIESREELLQHPHKLHQKTITPQIYRPHHKNRKDESKQLVNQDDNTLAMEEDNHNINQEDSHEVQLEEIKKIGVLSLLEDYQKEEERVNELLKIISEIIV